MLRYLQPRILQYASAPSASPETKLPLNPKGFSASGLHLDEPALGDEEGMY